MKNTINTLRRNQGTNSLASMLNKLNFMSLLCLAVFFSSCTTTDTNPTGLQISEATSASHKMYVIEREVPGAGDLSQSDLNKISTQSLDVLEKMGSDIEWKYSYVTEDVIYCVFTAPNEELIQEHAKIGGFPTNSVSQVFNTIDPTACK
jgi:hypothetical protein